MRSRLVAILASVVVLFALAPAAGAATALTAPTKVVKIGKQTVGYRSFGSGRPLVMIMGLGGTMGIWDPTFLDALAAGGQRIVLLDKEGAGRTTPPGGSVASRRIGEAAGGLVINLKQD